MNWFFWVLLKDFFSTGDLVDESGGVPANHLYTLMVAADRFHAVHGRFPGECGDPEADAARYREEVNGLCSEVGRSGGAIKDELVVELYV